MRKILCLLLTAALTLPAFAWGPKTQLAIVTTALHLVSRETSVELRRLSEEVREGAAVARETAEELHPALRTNPVNAIANEMALLQAVKSKTNIDPYFGYRLGMLGKMVSQATAPMAAVDPKWRDLFHADVDKIISDVSLELEGRATVEPRDYFGERQNEARFSGEQILEQYETGAGMNEVVRASLVRDASRSANAVADVWFTVLTGDISAASIGEERLRDYVTNAYEFYIRRGNSEEIASLEQRYAELAKLGAGTRVRIGELMEDAGMDKLAIEQYEQALALEPTRRDVVERISDYYVRQGDAAREAEDIEAAEQAYARAVERNPLHPTAEQSRFEMQREIEARAERQELDQARLARATEFRALAQEEQQRGRYAESLVLLRQARLAYNEVSGEFPEQEREARLGVTAVEEAVNQMQRDLVQDAQRFSGLGQRLEVRGLAAEATRDLSDEGLQRLVEEGYDEALEDLQQELQQSLGS